MVSGEFVDAFLHVALSGLVGENLEGRGPAIDAVIALHRRLLHGLQGDAMAREDLRDLGEDPRLVAYLQAQVEPGVNLGDGQNRELAVDVLRRTGNSSNQVTSLGRGTSAAQPRELPRRQR